MERVPPLLILLNIAWRLSLLCLLLRISNRLPLNTRGLSSDELSQLKAEEYFSLSELEESA